MFLFTFKCLLWLAWLCYLLWTISSALWAKTDKLLQRIQKAPLPLKIAILPAFLMSLTRHFAKQAILGFVAFYSEVKESTF